MKKLARKTAVLFLWFGAMAFALPSRGMAQEAQPPDQQQEQQSQNQSNQQNPQQQNQPSPQQTPAPGAGQQPANADTSHPAATSGRQPTTGSSSQSGSTQNPNQPGLTTKEKENIEHEKETGTSKDRVLWMMPNFLTIENADQVPPLTTEQKFATVGRGLIDPWEFGIMALGAGIEQASNSIPEYGQGFQGYAKRYVTAYADNAVENVMASAVLPSLLHQDPRYYQLGHGGFAKRTLHAFSRLFITRTDSGGEQFNASEVLGAGMAAAISDYGYHPQGDRSFGNVANVWGTQMGWDLSMYMLKEFWPDLRHFREHHHHGDQAPLSDQPPPIQ
jgi:hypothetical protein